MKNDFLKKIILAIGIVIIIALVIMIALPKEKQPASWDSGESGEMNNPNEQQGENEYSKLEEFEMEKTFSQMEELLTGINLNRLSEEEIENEYNFGDYKDLEKVIASSKKENEINEIAIVKLDNINQSSDILMIFLDRIEKLKQENSNNKEILQLLETEDKVIFKQARKYAVMIIAENAKELEEQFDKNLGI